MAETILIVKQFEYSEGVSVGENIAIVLRNITSFVRKKVTINEQSYEVVKISLVDGRDFLIDETAVDMLNALMNDPNASVANVGSSA